MNRSRIRGIVFLLAISALAYLPFVARLGYYNDDWYLMYSAGVRGPSVFWDIFGVDRPLRALVTIPAYWLFGANPLFYNLSAYAFRVLGALALLWTLRMLWPRQHSATFVMALLFLVYPGFLSQPNAIDYQSHLVGLAAALLSVAATTKAVLSEGRAAKWLWFAFSILLGWFYLGQMEWYIGFEFFRWGCVFLLSSRQGGTLIQKGWRALGRAFPALTAPIAFLTWRVFFFQAERGATDLGAQLVTSDYSPAVNVLTRLAYLAKDMLNVLVSAWGVPLYQLTSQLDLKPSLAGFAVATLAAGLAFLWLRRIPDGNGEQGESRWQTETLWLGLFAALFGLLPVILVNRHILFPNYSRYALVASVGAALAWVALFYSLSRPVVRNVLVGLFVGVAVLTHFANGYKHAQSTAEAREFWWQVSWRVPQLEVNTTLVAHYALGATEEDYFVWGPASLIYHPESMHADYIQPALHAAILNGETVVKVLTRQRQEFDNRRSIRTYKNYRNILILTQPTPDSCVQIIDGTQPALSRYENAEVRAIASYSEIERILADESFHIPPAFAFGAEPPHGWCYFYQQAALARQRGEWGEIVRIGEQAQSQGFEAEDLIEWIPFLEAYAHEGQASRLKELSPVIAADAYIASQACARLEKLQGLSEAVMQVIQNEYCIEN